MQDTKKMVTQPGILYNTRIAGCLLHFKNEYFHIFQSRFFNLYHQYTPRLLRTLPDAPTVVLKSGFDRSSPVTVHEPSPPAFTVLLFL